MKRIPLALAALASAATPALKMPASAHAESGFAIGAFGGYSDWESSAEGSSSIESGASAGIVLRYTTPATTGSSWESKPPCP